MATGNLTIIGRGSRVRGRITGTSNLEIHGLVDGEILVEGDLTVGETGMVASDLSGKRVVVRGAVKGNISGDESVHLEDGAKVVGDVRAPRVAIGAGALVKGYVQTGSAEARPRAAQKAAVASSLGARPAPAHTPAARPAPAPATVKANPPASGPALTRAALLAGANNHASPPRANAAPEKKGPPPPIVPALKKGAKGALAKKR